MSVSRSALSRALKFSRTPLRSHLSPRRPFHASRHLDIVKPFLLADIGEGITECQLIQWFVQPGARVEQFDKLCEVQSDKASVEITSPFDGVIKKLHYEPDDMAITGKPLVDIDIQSEISAEDEAKLADGGDVRPAAEESMRGPQAEAKGMTEDESAVPRVSVKSVEEQAQQHPPRQVKEGMGTLATPAVRHLTRELKVNIVDILGTGKDGRVLKEDVHRHVQQRDQRQMDEQTQQQLPYATTPSALREDKVVSLSPVQMQMYKTMTRALNIPHFLYTCAADMSAITALRKKINQTAASPEQKLTPLTFILKAASLALQYHPLLNASLDSRDLKKPMLTYRGVHNFGVAIDAPSGLLVPVIKNIAGLSITEIAAQLQLLSSRARQNKLTPADFGSATFTVSNIGSVGGGVVSPVISEPQVAILGIGRSKIVPAFDENDELVKREELTLSWSADHRVVDGAECARCAERVRRYLEEPGLMMAALR